MKPKRKVYIPGETNEQRKTRLTSEKNARGSYRDGETKEQRKKRIKTSKGEVYKPKQEKRKKEKLPPRIVRSNSLQRSIPPSIEKKIILQEPFPTEDISFVLGNGTSRRNIDPYELKLRGTLYGCNALYRECSPHYLIAVDTKMIREISNAGYQLNNSTWSNPNKYSRSIQGLNLFNPNLGWSSGPTALNFASINGAKTIYILGFDYQGLGKRNELVNNIYAGTENYKREQDRATYFGNWQRQTSMVIKRNPHTRYIRVVESDDYFTPDNLVGLENLEHITVAKFKKIFKLS
jgi:hypothetical protein